MSLETIQSVIPHRPPFLLIDEVVEQTKDQIVCRKCFTGDEFWYQGHYPDSVSYTHLTLPTLLLV